MPTTLLGAPLDFKTFQWPLAGLRLLLWKDLIELKSGSRGFSRPLRWIPLSTWPTFSINISSKYQIISTWGSPVVLSVYFVKLGQLQKKCEQNVILTQESRCIKTFVKWFLFVYLQNWKYDYLLWVGWFLANDLPLYLTTYLWLTREEIS